MTHGEKLVNETRHYTNAQIKVWQAKQTGADVAAFVSAGGLDIARRSETDATEPPTASIDTLQNLGDVRSDCKAVTWVWPNWIGNGLSTLVVAAPGIGKSTVTLCLAHCMYTGANWPDGTPNTSERGQTLWIETEAGHALHVDRAQRFGIPDECVLFAANYDEAVTFSDKAFCERTQGYATDPRIRLIAIDSLSGWSTGDENSTQAAAPMQYAATLSQRTGKPTVVVHHLTKVGWRTDVQNPPTLANVRGAGAIVQHARIVVALDAPFKGQPDMLRLTVIKNNYGSERPSLGLRLLTDRLQSFDLRSAINDESEQTPTHVAPTQREKNQARDARIRALSVSGLTQQAISDEVDVSIGTVNRVLKASAFNIQSAPNPRQIEKLNIENAVDEEESTPGALDFYPNEPRFPGVPDTPNPFAIVEMFDKQRTQYGVRGVN